MENIPKEQYYEFQEVDMDTVLEHPEVFIIPELIDICRILWDKGIDTFQCSNYRNDDYWIDILASALSEENFNYFYEQGKLNPNNFGTDMRGSIPMIFAEKSEEGLEQLKKIAESFKSQDSTYYIDNDQILDNYKRTDGEYEVLPNGNIRCGYNPLYKDATLEEALEHIDPTYYDPKLGRLYLSKRAFDVHNRYMSKTNGTR